ncbi:MAG: hypothetical protein IJ087_06960 [Eggerthellaceae bacterium]|nr:hypothetical protein [Eggerthellaceae bacterium]
MIAKRREDGSFVLGDAHGDLVEVDGPIGWAATVDRSDAEHRRERDRVRKRKQRERRPR